MLYNFGYEKINKYLKHLINRLLKSVVKKQTLILED